MHSSNWAPNDPDISGLATGHHPIQREGVLFLASLYACLFACLLVSKKISEKTTVWIFIKFGGEVGHDPEDSD